MLVSTRAVGMVSWDGGAMAIGRVCWESAVLGFPLVRLQQKQAIISLNRINYRIPRFHISTFTAPNFPHFHISTFAAAANVEMWKVRGCKCGNVEMWKVRDCKCGNVES